MSDAERVERLLRLALTPVEPPERLSDRLERGLAELTEAAADELADWEISTMRDPRNWVRPAAAVVVGTLAGGARGYAIVLGVVYLLVALLGFIAGNGDEIFNLIPVNTEDNVLHLLIGIAGVGAGLATPATTAPSTARPVAT